MDEWSIYSCDDHLDLRSVPRQLWQDRLPKDLAERGPRVVTGDGDPMWVCNDRVLGRSGLPQGDKLQVLSAVSRAGLEDDGFRVSNPKLRLGGHGPRRGVGVGHLRSDPTHPLDPRAGPAGRLLLGMERLGH